MNTAPKLHERLLKVAEGLKFNRETHVVWRDWLLKSPDNEKVNPHAGNAKFHNDTIREYNEHLATIDETLAALAPPSGDGVDSRLVPFEPTSEVIERICQVNAGNSIWPDDYDPRAQSIRRERAYVTYAAVLATATTPQSAPVEGDWIKWNGGNCPVSADTSVEYRLRNGSEYQGCKAGDLDWLHNTDALHPDAEIIAYRLTTPSPASQERSGYYKTASGLWRMRAPTASPPSSAAEASINSHEIDSKLIPDAAEQSKPDDPVFHRPSKLLHSIIPAEQAQAGERLSVDEIEGYAKGLEARDMFAEAAILRRLAGGVTVDDAMVERACISHYPRFDSFGESTKIACRFEMRRVLSAALVAALGAK